jgi:hypothetical protein
MSNKQEERDAQDATTDRRSLPGEESTSDPKPGWPGDGQRDGIEHDRREEGAVDPAEWGQTS